MGVSEHDDVILAGSGVGGGRLAHTLAQWRGRREAGAHPGPFGQADPAAVLTAMASAIRAGDHLLSRTA